jgi:hypothetical protein
MIHRSIIDNMRFFFASSIANKLVRLSDSLERIHKLTAGHRGGKLLAVVLIDVDRLIDDLAKFGKNNLGIRSVAAAIKQFGTTANEALILIGPFHQLYILIALSHRFESSIASFTARSW